MSTSVFNSDDIIKVKYQNLHDLILDLFYLRFDDTNFTSWFETKLSNILIEDSSDTESDF